MIKKKAGQREISMKIAQNPRFVQAKANPYQGFWLFLILAMLKRIRVNRKFMSQPTNTIKASILESNGLIMALEMMQRVWRQIMTNPMA